MLRTFILGGGFAAVEAARYLDRTVVTMNDVEVTLVSGENFAVFTPVLHEVAADKLSRNDGGWKHLKIQEQLGSPRRTRTSNISVNSRMLYGRGSE
jgi:NADH dehydrogenase FAD-containing subunit